MMQLKVKAEIDYDLSHLSCFASGGLLPLVKSALLIG